jgi:hypothetical protein
VYNEVCQARGEFADHDIGSSALHSFDISLSMLILKHEEMVLEIHESLWIWLGSEEMKPECRSGKCKGLFS